MMCHIIQTIKLPQQTASSPKLRKEIYTITSLHANIKTQFDYLLILAMRSTLSCIRTASIHFW